MLSLGIKGAVIIFIMPGDTKVGLCLEHKLALIPALYISIWYELCPLISKLLVHYLKRYPLGLYVNYIFRSVKIMQMFTLVSQAFLLTFNFSLYLLYNVRKHVWDTKGVIVSVLELSATDRGFESRSSQTKDYKIGICCLSANHTAVRKKSKDWFARNPNKMSAWSSQTFISVS